MKVKLMKKIRKRFSWFISSNGKFILIDHKLKMTIVYDEEHACKISGISKAEIPDKVQCEVEEWIWRLFKEHMTKPFGYNFNDVLYRQTYRIPKSLSNAKRENKV
jgi:hypothetical protein